MKNVRLDNVKQGIDLSLSYGRRMIVDAELLQKDGRYLSAIPLYILAYEELGKGMYLTNKFVRNVRVTESEWRKLAGSPYAHYQKIAVQYTNAINLLSRHSLKEIQAARAWEKQHGLYFPVPSRDFMIAKYKQSLAIVKKLPMVKQACYYVDYYGGKWLNLRNYSSGMLKDICTYLHSETMIMYYVSKVTLVIHSLGIRKAKNWSKEKAAEILKIYLENEYVLALKNQRTIIHEASFVNAREHAFAVIDVIAEDYKFLSKH